MESLGIDCSIRLTSDAAMVNAIMRHPKVYPYISDDYSSNPAEFDCSQAMKANGVWFLLVEPGPLGVFMVHCHTRSILEVHTCLLPSARGMARGIAEKAMRFIFDNLPCDKLITWVPEDNRLARKLALDSGMMEEGFSPKSWKKGGKMLGRYLLGIERDRVCQQQR